MKKHLSPQHRPMPLILLLILAPPLLAPLLLTIALRVATVASPVVEVTSVVVATQGVGDD